MQIVRVFSGDDGESHFEDVAPEEMVAIAKRLGEGDIQLNERRCAHAAPDRNITVSRRRPPSIVEAVLAVRSAMSAET